MLWLPLWFLDLDTNLLWSWQESRWKTTVDKTTSKTIYVTLQCCNKIKDDTLAEQIQKHGTRCQQTRNLWDSLLWPLISCVISLGTCHSPLATLDPSLRPTLFYPFYICHTRWLGEVGAEIFLWVSMYACIYLLYNILGCFPFIIEILKNYRKYTVPCNVIVTIKYILNINARWNRRIDF